MPFRVNLEDLLMAGTHFGHLTRRWNPKMKPYIFMPKNGIHIIDLKKSLSLLEEAYNALQNLAANGEKILFVGTKKQAQSIIRDEAIRCGMFYVTDRWLGGTLTNFATIRKSIKHMKNLEKKSTDGTYEKITKKEILTIEREKEKMKKVLGGIEEMSRLPGAIYVVDTIKEYIAVKEAHRLDIPVYAILDTNCAPDLITYPIPGNDDALKSISIITKTLADAVIEGTSRLKKNESENSEKVAKGSAETVSA